MKTIARLLACFTVVASAGTSAQFVLGNEAVRVDLSGRHVETPPVLRSLGAPCAAAAKCHAGAWRMVEAESGLVECTEPSARATTCRASSYGVSRLPRVWVVKRKDEWLQCQYPDLRSVCKPIYGRPPANLPEDAVQ